MTCRILTAASLAALAAACGPAPKEPVLTPPAATSATAPGATTSPERPAASSTHQRVLPPNLDFEITLSPEPAGNPVVRVTLAARPDGTSLDLWQGAKVLDLAGEPQATDDRGAVGVTVDTSGGVTRFTLDRAPSGVTWLSYTVAGKLPAYPDPPAIALDPDRFEGAGEAMLVVPAAFEGKSVRAAIRTETDEIGTRELVSAAGSFGHGHRVETVARGADLREGFYLAGLMGQGTFRAPEGNDDAAWLGYTAFDPRPVFADMAGLRTALKLLFRGADADKVTFLFVSDSRPEGTFVVSRRPRSVLSRIGVQERWSAPLRIAVAAAVVHGWIGSRLWIGPNDPAHEAEAYWFTEGVSRNLARELLFRYGLISPAEAAEEVEGLASVVATSPLARLSNEDLAKKPKAAVPVLVARGALYALRVDALIRARTKGKRSLDNVLSELYAAAAESKAAALPASAWVDAVVKDLGDGERAAFRDAIELGKPFELPDTSLGPCFRRVTRTYVGFEIGFDEEAALKGSPNKIVGLVRGGPAEKAGLREGDEIAGILVGRRSASEPVRVRLVQSDATKTVSYKPEGKRVKGTGFDRKRDVGDDACTP